MRKIAIAVLILVATGAARADEMEKAVEHFNRGKALFEASQFEGAVKEFEAAHMLHPNALLLYNIAEGYESLGALANTVKYLRMYLRAKPDADDRDEVLTRIRNLEARLQDKAPQISTVRIDVNTPGAAIILDGKVMGTSPLGKGLEVAPGSYTVRVEAPKHAPWEQTLVAKEGRETNLIVHMERLAEEGPSGLGIGAWTAGGAALALAVTGAILGGVSASLASDIEGQARTDLPYDERPPWTDGLAGDYATGQSLEAASIAMFVIAGAAAATSATLFILDSLQRGGPKEEASAGLTATVGPGGVGARF